MTPLELRARRCVAWAASDEGAKWAFRLVLVLAVGVFWIIGRHQWFTRDDWGLILTREHVLDHEGWSTWLFDAQDGHWLAIPTLIYHVLLKTVGIHSYWPFLLTAMASHVAAVFLARTGCRRVGVTAWTTTLVCSTLLLFGSGWDNIVFAIQVCYNLSLVLFLAQLLLVDHDGPLDRRDYIGAVFGVLGMMTSGFGPIFMVGIATLLVLRRRWKALAVAIVPQALVYGWWLLTWASDDVAHKMPGDKAQVPAFVVRGITATFEGLLVFTSLAGVAILATTGFALWRGIPWTSRRLTLALATTVTVMFAAIGWERIGFGVFSAASTRYVHVAAIVIAPAFALAVDQLGRLAIDARWAGRLVLLAAFAVNVGALRTNSAQWAIASRDEKRLLELIVGSGLAAQVPPTTSVLVNSPNVHVYELPWLVEKRALQPKTPTAADLARVRAALGLPAP